MQHVQPLVPRGWVLLRVKLARWCSIDGFAAWWPLSRQRIAGCSGAGVVAEHGVDADTDLPGRQVVLGGYSPEYLPPLNVNGWLAEYTSAPSSLLIPVGRLEPRLVFYPDAVTACSVAEELEAAGRSVLVYGAGFYGLSAAHLALDAGLDVDIVTNVKEATRIAREMGARVYTRPPSGRHYDAIVLAAASANAIGVVETYSPSLIVLHPLHTIAYNVPVSRRRRKYIILVGWIDGEAHRGSCGWRLLDRVWRLVGEYVRVVEGLEKPPETAPWLGLVYRLG
ncbi:Zn-binding dehydrogenase [Hyperthermus butylicus DSM 5456]|uniref:Zn-binding dehydrogenase n=1 Tax=Hyperthermus butylicus (strain DSM 5456 / JCM 9403 / PLM1-5) TaxID=415426 RepID=A2BJW9_HYPBU|nr:Zn-binding dehydrogenase [Hyperthermus butylicus DSM 5456]